jgi:hypothetical protein
MLHPINAIRLFLYSVFIDAFFLNIVKVSTLKIDTSIGERVRNDFK